MDMRKLVDKVPPLLRKYKYALLVLAIGLVLMAWPEKKETTDTALVQSNHAVQTNDTAKELETILQTIQGVGRVQVMLTIKAGESTLYQTDEDHTISDDASSIHKQTVIITDSQRNERPLVVQIIPPQYLGAVIVCQGAENAAVRLAVVEAVSKATGLGADRISVLKMK